MRKDMEPNDINPEKYDKVSLLSLSKAARIMKVGKKFISNMIEQGEIRTILNKNRVLIPYSELCDWIQGKLSYSIKNSVIPEKVKQSPKINPKEIMKEIKLKNGVSKK